MGEWLLLAPSGGRQWAGSDRHSNFIMLPTALQMSITAHTHPIETEHKEEEEEEMEAGEVVLYSREAYPIPEKKGTNGNCKEN